MGGQATEAGLQQNGFRYLTKWELRGNTIKPISLDWDDASGWIYAFVAEGCVRYVGIASTVLRSRLDGYSYQINDRVRALIRKSLEGGRSVSIYGLERPEATREELEEQESAFIRNLNPDWNVRR